MLKLAVALNAWEPAAERAADPVQLLGAAWAEIVGPENAEKSHPGRIEGETLLVTTAHAGWSSQLSFIGEEILARIQARLPQAGIAKLRFRVGRLLARGSVSPGKRVGGKGKLEAVHEREPAASAADALARFRTGVDAAQRAKRAHGWKECAGCNALIAPHTGTFCISCEIARGAERERRIARLLYEAPWLGFAGTARLIEDLRQDEYESIRRRLLQRWWDRLRRVQSGKVLARDGSDRLIAGSYVLLQSDLRPENVTPAIVRNLLGDELYDLMYETERP